MNKKVDFPTDAHPVSSELLEVVHGFDSHELFWLSGYCSGLAKGRNDVIPLSSDSIATIQDKSLLNTNVVLKTLVLYGSQTGNSQIIAESLFEKIKQEGLSIKLASLNDFNPKELTKYQIIFLVVSTQGEGEPPDDAIDFFDFIKSKRAPKLTNLQHAVLALGDSSYEFFCQTGKDFDQAFIQQGSQPLIERVDCDLDYEEVASQWIDSLVQKTIELSSNNGVDDGLIIQSQSQSQSQSDSNSLTSVANQFTRQNPFVAKILSNQKITGKGSDKQVQHIEISLADSGLRYLPGDSVGIWPKNNPQLVDEILNQLSLDGEQLVSIKGTSKTLRRALQENLEITLLNTDFIKSYVEFVALTDKKQSDNISNTVLSDYSSYINNHQLIDVLALAPVDLQAQQLVDLLKPIKSRVYSISSSLDANEDEVHITVALKESVNGKGTRRGAASDFLLETLEEDDEVQIYIEQNKRFKLPADDVPIIMIGPGTGIAPFRAFLQQRYEQSANGDNWLFFGNPNFNTDFLYQLELQKYHQQGLLTRINLAFSRDQNGKIYVQDRLLENAGNIWKWINDKGACLYVCGDMSHMAKDVEKTLIKIISGQGERSIQDAKDFLKILKKENRYQRDVY